MQRIEFCHVRFYRGNARRSYSHRPSDADERYIPLDEVLKSLGDEGWSMSGVAGSEFGSSYNLFFQRLHPPA